MTEAPNPVASALPEDITEDALLGGAVRLRQPAKGYRVAIDPVLLAAAVPAGVGDTVLDLGTGTGAAALCLAHRVMAAKLTGLEIQPELADIARENAALNQCEARVQIIDGGIAERLPNGVAQFHHVMANPPFQPAGRARPSPNPSLAQAHYEGETPLPVWVASAFAHVRNGGSVTFIFVANRQDELLSAMRRHTQALDVFPLWPSVGQAAKRVLVRATKTGGNAVNTHTGLVLHNADGGFTLAALAILRDGKALKF